VTCICPYEFTIVS